MTGINKNTIVRFESGKGILFSTAERLEHAFAKHFKLQMGTCPLRVYSSLTSDKRQYRVTC